MIWATPIAHSRFFSSDFLDKCANYTALDNNNFIFHFLWILKIQLLKAEVLALKISFLKILEKIYFLFMHHIMKKIWTFLICDHKKQIIQECDQNSDREKAADFS